MKIAVTSANGKTICGHAGKCPGYLIYELNKDQTIRQKHIKLSSSEVLKNVMGQLSSHPEHPLFGINAFITQSLGEGLEERLKQDHIFVLLTNETDPLNVVNSLELTLN